MSTRLLGAATLLAALSVVVIVAIAVWDARDRDGTARPVAVAVATPAQATPPSPDREALVAFYHATGANGLGWPGHPAITQIQRHIADAVNMALTGTLSPKEALDFAAEEVNEVLSDY